MKPVFVIVGCVILAAAALLFVVPTVVIGLEGGFRWRYVSSEISPDGQLQVIVTKRMAFPASDWVDPAIVVRAELRDAAKRRVLASGMVRLTEDSDFTRPAIDWAADGARVRGFDQRMDQAVTLRRRVR
jgi:hypothetical protein